MDYRKLYRRLLPRFNRERLIGNTAELTALELGQTLSAKLEAAELVEKLLKSSGVSDVQSYAFPLDGKTVYQDKVMPLAWEASIGRLIVLKSAIPANDPVLADYDRHPFELIQGSPALPPEGRNFRVITYEELCLGADPQNALVLFPEDSRPLGARLKTILDLGASGVINQYSRGAWESPDTVAWVNGNTASGRWGLTAMDQPYLGFSITPRRGAWLRQALRAGEVVVHAECDGRNFAAELPAFTAVIPGVNREKEVWLLAHLYEPLADDNSAGVIAAIEILRQINQLILSGSMAQPDYSIRVLLAMEYHGFAALWESLPQHQVVGAINLDRLPVDRQETGLNFYLAPPPIKAPGNAVMREVVTAVEAELDWQIKWSDYGFFKDDAALADSTTGVPVIWPHAIKQRFWHNSAQIIDQLDSERFAEYAALVACWTIGVSSGQIADGDRLGQIYLQVLARLGRPYAEVKPVAPEEALPERAVSATHYARRIAYIQERLQGELDAYGLSEESDALAEKAAQLVAAYHAPGNPVSSEPNVWLTEFAKIVPKRLTVGLPYDLSHQDAWHPVLATIYSPTGRILAGADGVKNLQTLTFEVEFQLQRLLTVAEWKKIFTDLARLEKLGYVKLDCPNRVTAEQVKNCLQNLGVQPGDTVMLHAELSNLGPLDLTPEEINAAILAYLGPEGTLLEPAFGNPYQLFAGNPSLEINREMRPWRPDNLIVTGALARALLQRPDCCRDGHVSHEVIGCGAHAAEYLAGRDLYGPPIGADSVWSRLAGLHAKIVMLGCSLGTTSYLHYLETEAQLWYLAPGLCAYQDAAGKVQSAWVPQHLDGCRDFYRGRNTKFFTRAEAAGLHIATQKLGVGQVLKMEADELHRIGQQLLRDDPEIMLCDDPLCFYCQNAKSRRSPNAH